MAQLNQLGYTYCDGINYDGQAAENIPLARFEKCRLGAFEAVRGQVRTYALKVGSATYKLGAGDEACKKARRFLATLHQMRGAKDRLDLALQAAEVRGRR